MNRAVVTISRKELGGHQQLHIVAVDPNNTVYRTLALAETKRKFVDLRLIKGLDPKASLHAAKEGQRGQGEGLSFKLDDVTTSRFEAYDSLSGVYGLYVTLNSRPQAGRVRLHPQLA